MFLLSGRKFIVASLLFATSVGHVLSQYLSAEEKKSLMQARTNNIAEMSDSAISKQNDFLNGKIHYPINNQIHHPYFGENKWQEGKLYYRSDEFTTKSLKYDIKSDHLIVLPYYMPNAFPIALNKNYVHGFQIEDHLFKYIADIELMLRTIPDGYAEVVYDGDTKFYIKRRKEEAVDNTLRQLEYDQIVFMLLWKDGQYHRVRNKMGLLWRLDDKRKEVRQYIRDNNIEFGKDDYSTAKTILEYYDKL